MDRNNYGTGQVVTEGELDGSFDYCEDAERNQAIDSGQAQVAVGSTPDADVYGGILKGLTVTGTGSDTVNVTVGVAKDNQGRRISLENAATVKVTNIGESATGDYTNATGDGATVLTSCPTSGDRIVLSLFIVYDESTSDTRQDTLLVNYDFEEAESYHFSFSVGTAFTPPPGSTPTRPSLADNKVLLADILLESDGSAMSVIAICTSTADWDALGGNYANLDGRRGDWLALDDTTNDPLLVAESQELRGGNARDILRQYIRLLQSTTDGNGDDLLAAIAKTGSTTAGYQSLADTRQLVAGTINSHIKELLDMLRLVLWNGGGNSMQPRSGLHGLTTDPSELDDDKAILVQEIELDGANYSHRIDGMRYGHIARAHEIFDDFLAVGDGSANIGDAYSSPWGYAEAGAASEAVMIDAPGGVVRLTTGTTASDYVRLATGDSQGGSNFDWWALGAAPYAMFMCRFRIPSAVTGVKFAIGFFNSGNLPPAAASSVGLYFYYDQTTDAKLYLKMQDTTGSVGGTVGDFGALSADTWYTVRAVNISGVSAYGQLASSTSVGPFTEAAVTAPATCAGSASFVIYVTDVGGGVGPSLDIDQVHIADAQLAEDMTL